MLPATSSSTFSRAFLPPDHWWRIVQLFSSSSSRASSRSTSSSDARISVSLTFCKSSINRLMIHPLPLLVMAAISSTWLSFYVNILCQIQDAGMSFCAILPVISARSSAYRLVPIVGNLRNDSPRRSCKVIHKIIGAVGMVFHAIGSPMISPSPFRSPVRATICVTKRATCPV